MSKIIGRLPRFLVILVMVVAAGPSARAAGSARLPRALGTIEADVKSDYSHIRIRRQGDTYFMNFVRERSEEAIETMVNMKRPYELLSPYTRYMFASYLFRPNQEKVLIVGLGGGAMVHFYQHYDPSVEVDAVEIDPAVVKLADQYFQVRTGAKVKIVTDDAFHYLEKTDARYDVIYMDAFLKPSSDTDSTGIPLRLKTVQFYKGLQKRLAPDGVMAINLNANPRTHDDVQTIRGAFPQIHVFRVPGGNVVVIGVTAQTKETPAALRGRARQLDGKFKTNFSFHEMVKSLAQ